MDILELPTEVLIQITLYLDVKSVVALSETCQRLFAICQVDSVWKSLTYKRGQPDKERKKWTAFYSDQSWHNFYIWEEKREKRWKKGECDGFLLSGHLGRVFGVGYLGPSHVLTASDDGDLRIWDRDSRECVRRFLPDPNGGEGSALFDIVVDDQNENQLLACTFGGSLCAIQIDFDQKNKLYEKGVSELKTILQNGYIRYSDCVEKSDLVNRIIENHLAPIEKRVRVVRGHQGPIVTVKSYKETVATCSFDSTIHIWDKEKLFSSERYRNEDLLTCSVYGHMSAVNAIAWDGVKLASAGNDTLILLWNVITSQNERTLSGHDGWIWALEQVCPESPIYFSASVDETIRVWDVRRPNPCIHMISDFKGPVAGLSLNWEKNRIVTGSFDGKVRVFDPRNYQMYFTIDPSLNKVTRVVSDENNIVCGGYCEKAAIVEFGYLS